MAGKPGSSLCPDGSGPGEDYPRGFNRHEFRDARRTAIVIASGPTASGTLASSAANWRDWPTITINSSWRLNPCADIVYAADGSFWRCIDPETGIPNVHLIRQAGQCAPYTCDVRAAKEFGLNYVEIERKDGLNSEAGTPFRVRTGGHIGNSGAQGINLAFHLGARRLVLVGFDMQKIDGEEHWHGRHPEKQLRNDSDYSAFVRGMAHMAVDLHKLGTEVINCSPKSMLPYWRKSDLDEALLCQ